MIRRFTLALLFVACLPSVENARADAAPTEADVRDAMGKAAKFLMDRLAVRGGFVWKYSLDLKERYGELKARDTTVWVEPPGTPTVGLVLLDAYRVTGDPVYLAYADRVAAAPVEGQLPCGGWHYFIDDELSSVPHYYESFLSRQWGWQEYWHYEANATFDDDVSASATRFLLRLHGTPLASKYREPLWRALALIREAQYPNGAWPQRYPPPAKVATTSQYGPKRPGRSERPGRWGSSGTSSKRHPDYTSFYTFNDGVMSNTIALLLESHRTLGEDWCRQAARRGMDFYLLSQLPDPQAGWAQQYDLDLKPGWGRTFEPPAVCASQTLENISDLMDFYLYTGERKYLGPIPKAIDWLARTARASRFDPPYTHTFFYALGTDRPLFMRIVEKTDRDVRFEKTDNPHGAYPYGLRMAIDVNTLRKKYERVAALPPADARAEYEKRISAALPVIKLVSVGADTRVVASGPEEIQTLIASLGSGDGWVVDNQVLDISDFLSNPPRVFKGYDTGTYVARMYRFIHYLRGLQKRDGLDATLEERDR